MSILIGAEAAVRPCVGVGKWILTAALHVGICPVTGKAVVAGTLEAVPAVIAPPNAHEFLGVRPDLPAHTNPVVNSTADVGVEDLASAVALRKIALEEPVGIRPRRAWSPQHYNYGQNADRDP